MSILKILLLLPASAAATIIAISTASALSDDRDELVIDRKIELACHRNVKQRTPLGHRDMKTDGYSVDEPNVLLVTGGLKSELKPGQWSSVNWACRVRSDSRRILSVEFSMPVNGNNLKAISSSI